MSDLEKGSQTNANRGIVQLVKERLGVKTSPKIRKKKKKKLEINSILGSCGCQSHPSGIHPPILSFHPSSCSQCQLCFFVWEPCAVEASNFHPRWLGF
jgi:hypothetical protein